MICTVNKRERRRRAELVLFQADVSQGRNLNLDGLRMMMMMMMIMQGGCVRKKCAGQYG